MKIWKQAPLAAALALATTLSGGASAADLMEVNVLLPIPEGIPLNPIVVAREKGFFADNGIAVTSDVADGSGYLSQQIVAGNSQFALMGAADAVVAFTKRDDVRVLFCNQVKNVYRIVAKADSGVTDMAGLNGKALGYTEPGGGESKLVAAAIDEAGLVVNDSIKLIPIGGAGPQSLVALQNDTVQAYSSSFPDVAALSVAGIEWVDITPAKYSNVPGACMVTTEEVLSSEAGMAASKALAKSWVDAQYYAIEDGAGALATVCGKLPSACENKAAADALFAESMNLITPVEGHRPGELNPDAWNTVVEILASGDLVDAGLDITPLISGENVEAVISAAYEGR